VNAGVGHQRLAEYVDGLPNLSGHEQLITEAITAGVTRWGVLYMPGS
jgi:hypothetical protein